jgi:hypothetical protein
MISPFTIRYTVRPLFLEWRASNSPMSYQDFVTAQIEHRREEAKRCDCGDYLWEWVCDRCKEPICQSCDRGGWRSLHDCYEGCICKTCKENLQDMRSWDD